MSKVEINLLLIEIESKEKGGCYESLDCLLQYLW